MESATDELTRYYTKLFTLGTLKDNVIRFSLTYVLQVIYLISITLFIPRASLTLTPLATLSILYLISEKFLILDDTRDKKLFTLRRLLALNTITNLIVLLGIIIFTPLIIVKEGVLSLIFLIAGIILGFKLIVYYSISKQSIINILFILFIPIAVLTTTEIYVYGFKNILLNIVEPIIFGLVFSSIFLYAIYIKSKRIAPQGVYEYLKGYVDSWVLNDPSYLDELLSEHSIDIQLRSDIILFPDTYSKPSILLIPYFHFGPFKNVGSSIFPAAAGEYYYAEKDMNAVVFHTPATHDLDLSENDEMYNILRQLSELDNPIIFSTISDIHDISLEKARAYAVKLENSILLILEAEEMEDIPFDVARELRSYGRKLAYKHVIVVDAHNSLQREEYSLSKDVVNEILLAGKKILKESLDLRVTPFKVSVIKTNVPGLTPKKGLGNNGISVILWETFSGYNAIVCIDSNNMSPALRESLKKHISEKYNSKVIVTSTDTHEVTALQLNKRGYNLLGENKTEIDIIIDSIDKAFNKAAATLKETEGLIYAKNIRSRILGINTFDRLRDLLKTSYSTMKKIIYYFIIPTVILHIIGIYIYSILISL